MSQLTNNYNNTNNKKYSCFLLKEMNIVYEFVISSVLFEIFVALNEIDNKFMSDVFVIFMTLCKLD